jgi:hypothetical protein
MGMAEAEAQNGAKKRAINRQINIKTLKAILVE